MVVDAVLTLDQQSLDASMIGIKKVPGGGMEESLLVKGVAFKKTFSYAGFEQQPKKIENPKVLCLNVELELKAERDNAEVRIEQVSVRFHIVFSLSTLCACKEGLIPNERVRTGLSSDSRRRMVHHLP